MTVPTEIGTVYRCVDDEEEALAIARKLWDSGQKAVVVETRAMPSPPRTTARWLVLVEPLAPVRERLTTVAPDEPTAIGERGERDGATWEQASDRDHISRKIATVRNHRDADNCWPQWANLFADEIERLRAAGDKLAEALDVALHDLSVEAGLDYPYGKEALAGWREARRG